MLKQLTLLRHARADWQVGKYPNDRLKPLNALGQKQLPTVANWLRENDCAQPDLIIASPAERTFVTAQIIAEHLGYPKQKIIKDERLYDNTLDDLIAVISQIANEDIHILLVGHNPSLSLLIAKLDPLQETIRLSPADICQFKLNLKFWSELMQAEAKAHFFHAPQF